MNALQTELKNFQQTNEDIQSELNSVHDEIDMLLIEVNLIIMEYL